MHTAERGRRSRADGPATGRFDPVQQAPVAQQFHDLPVETVGLRGLSQPRLPLQYQRPHSGQAQLTGQHQAGRAGAHDDHVGVHHWLLPSKSFGVGLNRGGREHQRCRVGQLVDQGWRTILPGMPPAAFTPYASSGLRERIHRADLRA